MRHITRDEALKLLVRNNPEPVASHCDKSMWWFITRAVGGLWVQHPLKMTVSWLYLLMLPLIYVQKSIGFAIIGIPFVFFCILAYYFYFYRKLYKALRENTYRIDEDGISVSITTVDGIQTRYLTTQFSLIRNIWMTQNYIYIETEDKTDIGVVYLFSDEPERILGNIVSYMQLEKKAKEDKPIPYYSAEERTDLRNFVQERFGKIDAVLHDTDGEGFPIDIVSIPPTKQRNYWTLCTVGAGAIRVPNQEYYKQSDNGEITFDATKYTEGFVVEHFEYVMYLPPDWNVTDADLSKDSNYWYLRLLRDVVQYTYYNFQFQLGDTLSYNDSDGEELSFDASTDFFAVLMLCPLPDVPNEMFANIGGRTIQFHQVVPITIEESNYISQRSAADFMKKYMGIDAVQLDEEPIDVKHKQYSEALISHFEHHIRGANVVAMYPKQK
ncbi:suppressor of fused domain protein [Prevotella aurantiaca]|uniref:suppressor of fused domain protein n=1 Tax=Prevotella aurantiaca TaxID=596085 RepID=UPI0028DB50E9|nr:suppressor of fused domain protein [Prevotella aurantiaca]